MYKLLAIMLLLICSHVHAQVAVSITPIASLVMGLVKQTNIKVELLIPGHLSPHTYYLRPSDRKICEEADLIISVGPMYENSLAKLFESYSKKHIIWSQISGIKLLSSCIKCDHHAHKGHDHHDDEHTIDGHLWLNPTNAIILIKHLEGSLTLKYPHYAEKINKNAKSLTEKLNNLSKRLRVRLSSKKIKPRLVYHDAYQYFEAAYSLPRSFFVSENPELPLPANRLSELKQLVAEHKIKYIFKEPQFDTLQLENIAKELELQTLMLDPLGANYPCNEDNYFVMIETLAEQFIYASEDK